MALIAGEGLFDAAYYLDNNPDVATAGLDALEHYCRHGWRELRNPSREFDVWWYWANYLDPGSHAINPLVHYALFGRTQGLAGRPKPDELATNGSSALTHPVRRICLFAGYDADGVVDDYVVRYVRELSRHAEVYYLADCAMGEGELEKLSPYVRGAWARRHGEYDFGSWSRLARELVGWEEIEGFDELVLANDSCYLVRGLDGVFAKMDATPCDWWGMQATKGIAATRDAPSNRFRNPVPLDEVLRSRLAMFEQDYTYDFLVGSYFLAFRSPVLRDEVFRKLLARVAPQKSKKLVIQKYEIGLTRLLLSRGHVPATFVDDLHPFHPIFSDNHFALLSDGFPLFKRYLLSDNHYGIAGLSQWKARILSRVPDAPVEEMERNLLRVGDDEKLSRSFSIADGPDGLPLAPRVLSEGEMQHADRTTPKFDHWWAFPVCAYDHLLTGNERAVFEWVRDDPSIRKVVLTRGKRIELSGENVLVCPLGSPEGQYHLLRCRQVFVKHSPKTNVRYTLSSELHNFINLWHGIPLKRFGPASLDMHDKLAVVHRENRSCRAVISSSKIDAMAMAAAFYPLPYRDVWVTGLPRNDFIVCEEARLPGDFRAEMARLDEALAGRRLVLFAPTFKNAQADGYYGFDESERRWLQEWLHANGAVLGVREHMADQARTYSSMLSDVGMLDLSSRRYPNIEVLYRRAWTLVTDYSSCAIDFMLTGRAAISFAYDLDRYENDERGLFYDLDHVFPGPVCRDFGQLAEALQALSEGRTGRGPDWSLRRRVFFDHVDDRSAHRVVAKVKSLHAQASGRAA